MKYNRIISKLDIKGPNLVKGIHLEGLRVLGKPEVFAKAYYKQGVDEIIYQDAVASLYQRNSLTEIISRTVQDIFIPLTVGGGIRSLDDINKILRAGGDKVSINTAAIKTPRFINEASQHFGSSTILVAIEASLQPNGEYLAYTDNGREYTGLEVISWAKEIEDRGAGEILLTSIDNEGTGKGFDVNLAKQVRGITNIPIILSGGFGKVKDIIDVFKKCEPDAVAFADAIHYEKTSIKKIREECLKAKLEVRNLD